MPIYEYQCLKCDNKFEELVRGDENPSCPRCGASEVEKLVSACARSGGRSKGASSDYGGSSGGCGCGSCSGGNCGSCCH